MIKSTDISDFSILAWLSLGMVSCYYVALIIGLRWHPGRVQMTRYQPPAGISPSMAAYLRQNGECERAFAAGIISLCAKGYLRIEASGEEFRVTKVRDADNSLSGEESALLLALFPKNLSDDCEFNGVDPGRLAGALHDFQEAIDDLACPNLLSPHTRYWIIGVLYPLGIVVEYAGAILLSSLTRGSIGAFLYFCIWIVLGVVSLAAALRLWPATIRKIISWMSGSNKSGSSFKYGDANPVFLTASALFGFALLAAETSASFAFLIAVYVVIFVVSRHLLDVPTWKGRKILSELGGFREFLMRTEADRLSRKNSAQGSPLNFETLNAYAVALEIERGRGEEFATQLMQALEFDHAYSFNLLPSGLNTGVPEEHFLQLNLRDAQEPARKFSRKAGS